MIPRISIDRGYAEDNDGNNTQGWVLSIQWLGVYVSLWVTR